MFNLGLNKMKALLLLTLLTISALGEKVSFEGYTVFRLYPKTEAQRQLLSKLENIPELDFWSDVNHVGLPVDIMVKPELKQLFLQNARNIGLKPQVFIENVEKLMVNQTVGKYTNRMEFNKYYRLNDIYSWLDDLAASNPGVVSVIEGGVTHENRKIKGVKIAFKPGKPIFFIEAGIHAREWISPTTANFIIDQLLTSTDPTIRTIAESFEFHIFPSTNPDGYEYSHTSNRMWRKTRKSYGTCVGADPNRNWDNHWLEQGASTNPCSDTYAGSSVFSEIECKSLSEYISSIGSRMAVYISFHSYSQLFMLPYGWTTAPQDNYVQMMDIGRKSIAALASRYGTQYRVGNIGEIIYLASGGSGDWVKAQFQNVNVVVTYELRDRGVYGFLLPASQITPNGLEVMDSIVAMMQEAEKYGYVTLG